MQFASIGHLMTHDQIKQIPLSWMKENYIISPKFSFNNTSGYLLGLKISAQEMVSQPKKIIRNQILDAAMYLQNEYDIELIQLGALTTSATKGGKWLTEQSQYNGFVNHGDTYTAAVACQVVHKIIEKFDINPNKMTLAIVGAYGIIGEAISRKLTSQFKETILAGRKQKKLDALNKKVVGKTRISTDLNIKTADIVITATNHPSALLTSDHLKKGAYVIDIAQPSNVSFNLCRERPDIIRIDGGYVSIPKKFDVNIPGYPQGKIFSCISEVIMQSMENERSNHVGSIDMAFFDLTEKWAQKYGFILHKLTNFGKLIN